MGSLLPGRQVRMQSHPEALCGNPPLTLRVPWASLYIGHNYVCMYIDRSSLASAPLAPRGGLGVEMPFCVLNYICGQLHVMVCMVQVNYKMHITMCISIAILICMFHGEC